MMSNCTKLMHGQDFEDFKHCPKFIGICLRRLSQGSVTVENFLTKYQQSKSLSHDSSLVPQTLKNIRAELHKDNWETIESVTDSNVCLQGIFDFFKVFSHEDQSEGPPSPLTQQESRKNLQ